MSAHTSFRQGQPVFVQLKDGGKFKDRFVEKRSAFVLLQSKGKVMIENLRAMSVAR